MHPVDKFKVTRSFIHFIQFAGFHLLKYDVSLDLGTLNKKPIEERDRHQSNLFVKLEFQNFLLINANHINNSEFSGTPLL